MRISAAVFLIQEASDIELPNEQIVHAAVRSARVLSRWAEKKSVPEDVAAPIILMASQQLRRLIIHIRHLPVHDISDMALRRLTEAHLDLRRFFTDDDDDDGDVWYDDSEHLVNSPSRYEYDAHGQPRRRLSRDLVDLPARKQDGSDAARAYDRRASNWKGDRDTLVPHGDVRTACEKRAALHIRILFLCLSAILLTAMLVIFFGSIHVYTSTTKPNTRLSGLSTVVSVPVFAVRALYEALWVSSTDVMNLSTANVTAVLCNDIAFSTLFTAVFQTVSYNSSYGLLDIRAATMDFMNGRTVDTLLTPHMYGRLCQQNVSVQVQRPGDVAGSMRETLPILTPEACADDSSQDGVFYNLSQRQITGQAYLVGYMRDATTKVLVYSTFLDVALALTLSWLPLQKYVTPSFTIFGFVNPLSRYYGEWAMRAAIWYALILLGGATLLLWLFEGLMGLSLLSRLPGLPTRRRGVRALIAALVCATTMAALLSLSAWVIADAVRRGVMLDRTQTLYLYVRLFVAAFSSATLQTNKAVIPMMNFLEAYHPDLGFSMNPSTGEVQPAHMASVAQAINAVSLTRYNQVMHTGEKGGYIYCSSYIPNNNMYYVVVDAVPTTEIPAVATWCVVLGSVLTLLVTLVYLYRSPLAALTLAPCSSSRVRLSSLSMSYVSAAILRHTHVRPLNIRLLLYAVVALILVVAHLVLGTFVQYQTNDFSRESMSLTLSLLSFLMRVNEVGNVTSRSVDLPSEMDVMIFSTLSDSGTLVSIRSNHETPAESSWVSQYYGAQLVLSAVTTVVNDVLSYRTPLIDSNSPVVEPSSFVHRMLATANMNNTHGLAIEYVKSTINGTSFVFIYNWTAVSVCFVSLLLAVTLMEWGYGYLWKQASRPAPAPQQPGGGERASDADPVDTTAAVASPLPAMTMSPKATLTEGPVAVNADEPRLDVLRGYVYLAAVVLAAVLAFSLIVQSIFIGHVYLQRLTLKESQMRMSTVLAAFNSLLQTSLMEARARDPELNLTSFIMQYMLNVSWVMMLSSPTYVRWSLLLRQDSSRPGPSPGPAPVQSSTSSYHMLIVDPVFGAQVKHTFSMLPSNKLPVCGVMTGTATNQRLVEEKVLYCFQSLSMMNGTVGGDDNMWSRPGGQHEEAEVYYNDDYHDDGNDKNDRGKRSYNENEAGTGVAHSLGRGRRKERFYIMITQLYDSSVTMPTSQITLNTDCFTVVIALIVFALLVLVMWWLLRAAAQTGFAMYNPHNMMLLSSHSRLFQVFTLTSLIPRGQRAAWEVGTLMLCVVLLLNMTPMMNDLSELDDISTYRSVHLTQADVMNAVYTEMMNLMDSYALLPVATVLQSQLNRLMQTAQLYATHNFIGSGNSSSGSGDEDKTDAAQDISTHETHFVITGPNSSAGVAKKVQNRTDSLQLDAVIQSAYHKLIQLPALHASVLPFLILAGENSFMTLRARRYEKSYIKPQDKLLGVLDAVVHELPKMIASSHVTASTEVIAAWVKGLVELRDVLRKVYILDHIMINNNFPLHCPAPGSDSTPYSSAHDAAMRTTDLYEGSMQGASSRWDGAAHTRAQSQTQTHTLHAVWSFRHEYGKHLDTMLAHSTQVYETLSKQVYDGLHVVQDIIHTSQPSRTLRRQLSAQLRQLQRWESTVAMRQCNDLVWLYTAYITREIHDACRDENTGGVNAIHRQHHRARVIAANATRHLRMLLEQERRWRRAQARATANEADVPSRKDSQQLQQRSVRPSWEIQATVQNTSSRGLVLFIVTCSVYVTMVVILFAWYVMLQNHTAEACARMLRQSDRIRTTTTTTRSPAWSASSPHRTRRPAAGAAERTAVGEEDAMSGTGAVRFSMSSGDVSAMTGSGSLASPSMHVIGAAHTRAGRMAAHSDSPPRHGRGLSSAPMTTTLRQRHGRASLRPALDASHNQTVYSGSGRRVSSGSRSDSRPDRHDTAVMYPQRQTGHVLHTVGANDEEGRGVGGPVYALTHARRRRWDRLLRHPPRGTAFLFAGIALIALVPFALSYYLWCTVVMDAMSSVRLVTLGETMFMRLSELEEAMQRVEGDLLHMYMDSGGRAPSAQEATRAEGAVRIAMENFIEAYADRVRGDARTSDYFRSSHASRDSANNTTYHDDDYRCTTDEQEDEDEVMSASIHTRVEPLRQAMMDLVHAMEHERRVYLNAVPFHGGNALATARTRHSLQLTQNVNNTLVTALAPWAITSLTGPAPRIYQQLHQAMSTALTAAAAKAHAQTEQAAVLTHYMTAWDVLSGVADADLSVWHTVVAAARRGGSAVALRYDRFLTEVSQTTLTTLKSFQTSAGGGGTGTEGDELEADVDALVAAYRPLLQLAASPDRIAALFSNSKDDGEVPEVHVRRTPTAGTGHAAMQVDKEKEEQQQQKSSDRVASDTPPTTASHLTDSYHGTARYASVVTQIPSMASFRVLFAYNRQYVNYKSPFHEERREAQETRSTPTAPSIHTLTQKIVAEARKLATDDTVPASFTYRLYNSTEDVIYANLTLDRRSKRNTFKVGVNIKTLTLLFLSLACVTALVASLTAVYRVHVAY